MTLQNLTAARAMKSLDRVLARLQMNLSLHQGSLKTVTHHAQMAYV